MVKPILLLGILFLTMLLPYLPGRFDASAATLSFLVQVASYTSLLLMPVGLAWLLRRPKARSWHKLTVGLAGLIAVVTTLAAAAINELALGAIVGIGAIICLPRVYRSLRAGEERARANRNLVPVYLMIMPVLLVVGRQAVLPRAADWSADRAIRHSAALIAEIETFRDRRGHYPVSLQSLNRDFPTGVVGLKRFHYEPNGEAYNLFFIRPSIQLDAQEVVLFNPRGEHRFTSHELDILQYDGEALNLRRGDRRRTQLPHPNWISILFD
jgi:hypothetical protein